MIGRGSEIDKDDLSCFLTNILFNHSERFSPKFLY
jgi:hypothetical protein